MGILSLYLLPAALVFVFMTLVYFLAILRKNNGIVDIAWGIGFCLIAGFSMLLNNAFTPEHLLLNAMVFVWGLRLALHIFVRSYGKPEDFRYKNWRDTWRWFYLRSYLQIFMLQGVLMLIVATPIILLNSSSGGGVGALDYLGLTIWTIGFAFEAIGDFQLLKFIKNPLNKGKIMMSGVWSLTRHPNYFGEATLWWGVFLVALSSPFGLLAVVSPLLIDFLLLKVSGIPMLEKKYEGNVEYEAYKKRTNALFPWRRGL